jgi:sporulation protein YlmC with PRC-barrel domain
MNTRKTLVTAGAITTFGLGLAFGIDRDSAELRGQAGGTEHQKQYQAGQSEWGQEQQREFGAPSEARSQHEKAKHSKKASDLKGKEVSMEDGESLGKVQDIAVNLETGELAYLLVSEGDEDEDENGGQWKPVPPEAVQIQSEDGEVQIIVSIEKEQWENAPTVSEGELAQLGEEERAREIYQAFGEEYRGNQAQQMQFGAPDRDRQQGQQPGVGTGERDHDQSAVGTESRELHRPGATARTESGAMGSEQHQDESAQQEYGAVQRDDEPGIDGVRSEPRVIEFGAADRDEGKIKRASKLMDSQVKNQEDEEIGKISDLILNVEEGRVDFVLIEGEDNGDVYAVAPQALETSGEEELQLNVSRQDLQQAQELRASELGQHAQQAQVFGSRQGREDPQVYRFQEDQEESRVYGARDRGEDKDKDKKKEKDDDRE